MSKAEPEEVKAIQQARMTPDQTKGLQRLVAGAAQKDVKRPVHSAKPVNLKKRKVSQGRSNSLAGFKRMKKMMRVNAVIHAHPAALMAVRLQQLARSKKHGTQRRIQ
jgi:hypothetical protein